MNWLDIFFSVFILIFLVSIDLAAVGFSYGSTKVRVPFLYIFIISIIGSFLLGFALVAGYFLSPYISEPATKWTAFTLFMIIGFFKLGTWYATRGKVVKPNRIISLWEALIIAFIVAIDGVGVAFGVGLDRITAAFIIAIVLVSVITDIALFKLGHLLGSKISQKSRRDIGWIGGALLILIGILQLFI